MLLAKDVEHHCVTSADFFFTDEGELSIVTGDEEGIMRVYQHNPQGASKVLAFFKDRFSD